MLLISFWATWHLKNQKLFKTLIRSRFQGMYWYAHKTATLTSIQHTVPPSPLHLCPWLQYEKKDFGYIVLVVREPAQFETGIKAYDGSLACPQSLKSLGGIFTCDFKFHIIKWLLAQKNVLDLVYEIINQEKPSRFISKIFFMYVPYFRE